MHFSRIRISWPIPTKISSAGSLPHHTQVHSHQPPQSPLQEIFGRVQYTLPPSINRHMIQCHPTKITTTNQELQSKSPRKWLQTIAKHDKKLLTSWSRHLKKMHPWLGPFFFTLYSLTIFCPHLPHAMRGRSGLSCLGSHVRPRTRKQSPSTTIYTHFHQLL